MMDIRPIKTDADLAWAIAEVSPYFDNPPAVGSEDGNRFDVLSPLIEAYEDRHHSIPPADPIEVLRFVMEQSGRDQGDLADLLGSRSRASEILSGRRRLTVEMISKLYALWHIPAGALIPAYEAA